MRSASGTDPAWEDAFCGGGSIPFEAARIGCDAFGSDLSPVAALLTWAAVHIVGGGPRVAVEVRGSELDRVYQEVKKQIEAWASRSRPMKTAGSPTPTCALPRGDRPAVRLARAPRAELGDWRAHPHHRPASSRIRTSGSRSKFTRERLMRRWRPQERRHRLRRRQVPR